MYNVLHDVYQLKMKKFAFSGFKINKQMFKLCMCDSFSHIFENTIFHVKILFLESQNTILGFKRLAGLVIKQIPRMLANTICRSGHAEELALTQI